MLILGIDPALCNTGLAILDTDLHRIIYTRTIETSSKEATQERVHHIYGHIRQVIHTHQIKTAAIETQYLSKYSTALKIAMVYGACLVAFADAMVRTGHYSPACIKRNFVGIGTADKIMMIQQARLIYPELKKIDSHIADAVAVAHIHQQFL
jgi:crossover junction endodeoxyribonuclease RuvC